MTRKHFELIADSIDNLHYQGFTSQQVEAVAQQVANACAASNGRFDRERFIAACTKASRVARGISQLGKAMQSLNN
jgi:hypothetical protein